MQKFILFFSIIFSITLTAQDKVEIDEKAIAAELGLEWPVKEAAKTIEELEADLKSKAESSVEKTYPAKSKEDFEKEVISKYPLYKPGDKVNIKVKYRNSLVTVSGTFKKITSSSVYIDLKSYPLVDIDPKVVSQFSEKTWTEQVKTTTNKLYSRYDSDRRYGVEDYLEKHKNEFYKANGYSLVEGKWIKNSDYLKNAVAIKQEKLEAEKKMLEDKAKNPGDTLTENTTKTSGSRNASTSGNNQPTTSTGDDPLSTDGEILFSEEEFDKKAGFIGIAIIGIYVIMVLNQLAWLFVIFCEDGFLWLIGTLFIPFVGLILLIKNWSTYKKFFLIHIGLIAVLLVLIFAIGVS